MKRTVSSIILAAALATGTTAFLAGCDTGESGSSTGTSGTRSNTGTSGTSGGTRSSDMSTGAGTSGTSGATGTAGTTGARPQVAARPQRGVALLTDDLSTLYLVLAGGAAALFLGWRAATVLMSTRRHA